MNPGIAIQVDMICGEFQMTLEALATAALVWRCGATSTRR